MTSKKIKLYTKTGDQGETALYGGTRVGKDSLRMEVVGTVDELNAFLGLCRSTAKQKQTIDELELLQNELFELGAEMATPSTSSHDKQRISDKEICRLEERIDYYSEATPDLKAFVLPGGTEVNSYLHIARTVCRRAERRLVELHHSETISPLTIIYLNRLSDLLFAMARYEIHQSSRTEFLWIAK